MSKNTKTISRTSAREAAFLAVLAFLQEQGFAADVLKTWREEATPSSADFSLAQEIAYGTIRRSLTLAHYAKSLTDRPKQSLKAKEKALVYTALYQHAFMTRVPGYAIANESVGLAKRYCHASFAGFLNAILRKALQQQLSLPSLHDPAELSLRYSYPQLFIENLLEENGLERTIGILDAGNAPGYTMMRVRRKWKDDDRLEYVHNHPGMAILKDPAALPFFAGSDAFYIQNITPVILMEGLRSNCEMASPRTLLDLCAAPGGKLLLAHDFFPEASLHANDVSNDKIRLLRENCAKYGIEAHLNCSKGEEYRGGEPFDLIILDVPCSNTGVLNKRPEARWRLTEDHFNQLEEEQKQLLRQAKNLLAPNGVLWYLTCSILRRENEYIAEWARSTLGMRPIYKKNILPDPSGADGGFCCALK